MTVTGKRSCCICISSQGATRRRISKPHKLIYQNLQHVVYRCYINIKGWKLKWNEQQDCCKRHVWLLWRLCSHLVNLAHNFTLRHPGDMLGRGQTSLLATFKESLPNDWAALVSLMLFLWSPPTPALIGVGWNAPQSGNLQLSRSAFSSPQQCQCASPAASSEILDLLHPSPAESTAWDFEVFIFIPASSHLTQQTTCSDTPPCAATLGTTESNSQQASVRPTTVKVMRPPTVVLLGPEQRAWQV